MPRRYSPYRRAPRTSFERTGRLPTRTVGRSVRRGDYLNRRPRAATQAIARAARSAMEKKGMDTDLTVAGIINTTSTNGNITVLNLIQPGTGSWNRVGKKTHLKSVRVIGRIEFNVTPTFATGVSNETFVRMILVWDKQPSGGAIPTFDTIFGITSQTGTETCPVITCPVRYDNMDRFRVLRDVEIHPNSSQVPAFGSAPTIIAQVHLDEYVKLGSLESVYSGQSNPMTIADISTGALYCIFRSITNQANCTADVEAQARVRYTD